MQNIFKINSDFLPYSIFNTSNNSTTDTYSCDFINNNFTTKDKFIIEYYDAGSKAFPAGEAYVWAAPLKTGYTPYILKPIVSGPWSDKFATYVPYNSTRGFGIHNSGSAYTWNIGAYVLYVKND